MKSEKNLCLQVIANCHKSQVTGGFIYLFIYIDIDYV